MSHSYWQRGLLGRVTALSDRYLVPMADGPAAEFYQPNSTRLKRQYGWYLESVRRVNHLAGRLTSRGDSLADLLERGGGTAARPRPAR